MVQGSNIYEWRRIIDEAYATMDDGPEDYLFRKDGKQKLVGSADNEPEADEVELEEDDTAGYRYRDEQDYEEDNIKTWHYGKAPGGDWEVIDLSPYAHVDDFMWALIVDFHKKNKRWPNRDEGYRMEQLQHEKWKKENE